MALAIFANRLENMYLASGQEQELHAAITLARKALEIAKPEHVFYAQYLSNLSTKLTKLYLLDRRNRQPMEESTDLCKKAIAITPKGSASRALYLFNLAKQSLGQGLMDRDTGLVREGFALYRQAIEVENAPIRIRMSSAIEALKVAKHVSNNSEAIRIAFDSLKLLQQSHLSYLPRTDQQYIISILPDLGVDCFSAVMCEGDDDHQHDIIGLKLLETARGVMLGLTLDNVTLIKEARDTAPKQVGTQEANVSALDIAIPGTSLAPGAAELSRMQECISRACFSPTFDELIQSMRTKDLLASAQNGFVVVIVVTRSYTSTATVITSTSIRCHDLPKLIGSELEGWLTQDLTGGLNDNKSVRGEKNKRYRAYLVWLWDNCVQPLLCDILELAPQVDTSRLPRISWIGTGLASTVPFHAAGDHSIDSTMNTFNFAVSSYAATLKVLRYSQRYLKPKDNSTVDWRVLTVAMPSTPSGFIDLDGVDDEIAVIKASVMTGVDEIRYPRASQVLEAIPKYDVVHLACHGISHPANPTESSLVLQINDPDGSHLRADHLTVQAIADQHCASGRIAFLSACSTAENTRIALRDEALHLATSFQVAGFKHVIASLWSAPDETCVALSRAFYSQLMKKTMRNTEDADVARALHDSAIKLRDTGRNRAMPLRWAQYVHFGG